MIKTSYADNYELYNKDDFDGSYYSDMMSEPSILSSEDFAPDIDIDNLLFSEWIESTWKRTGDPFEDTMSLCELYKQRRKWKEALKCYEELLEAVDTVYAARRITPCISRCYREMKQPLMALKRIRENLNEYGNDIICQELLTTFSAVLGDYNCVDTAWILWRIADQVKVKDTEHLPNLAMRLAELERRRKQKSEHIAL